VTSQQREAGAGQRVGDLLRSWRQRRRLSQLELAERAGVSTRHLSFVENGRSKPTAEMILRLADHLDVPLREQDRLLLAGGFAPQFGSQSLAADSLEVVMSGLRDLVDAHLPYPALLLDTYWDVIDANPAATALLSGCDPSLLEPPVNALRASLHPRGLAGQIRNLDAWADHLIRQVTSRAMHTDDPRLRDLAAELAGYVQPVVSRLRPTAPVLALELTTPDGLRRFFTVAAQLETPTDSLLQGMHLETFVPADRATRAALSRWGTTHTAEQLSGSRESAG
jgi:transcriptional regulator with XRE-family HTH domain